MDIGMGEILLVLLFALLVYGGRLPEVARSLGRSLATLKRSLQETTDSVTRDVHSAIDLDLDERPRTVRRIPAAPAEPPRVSAASQKPAPTALATEDVSGEPPPDAPPA